MKEMFVVNGEEFKVGSVYSKAEAKKFKKVDNFVDAIHELTTKKHTIVLVEPVLENKVVKLKIVEELDYNKILNSTEILQDSKLSYICKLSSVIDSNECRYLIEDGINLVTNYMDDLKFSLSVINYDNSIINNEIYFRHIENLINKDTTGDYLKNVSTLRNVHNEDYYSKRVVEKMIEYAKTTSNIRNLLIFFRNVSDCQLSGMNDYIDLYEILSLIDKYDTTGEFYVQFNEVVPFFELNHIQSRIIELAKVNKSNYYCIQFLNNLILGYKFSYFKTIKLDDLVEVIVDLWDKSKDNSNSRFFIRKSIVKHLSKDSLLKLFEVCKDKKLTNNLIISYLGESN